MDIRLSPEQKGAVEWIKKLLPNGNIFVLMGQSGVGKTTILQAVQQQLQGKLIGVKDFIEVSPGKSSLKLDEGFGELLLNNLNDHQLLLIDSFPSINRLVNFNHIYPRNGFFNNYLLTLCDYAIETNKKIVFALDEHIPEPVQNRAFFIALESFKPKDYQAICSGYLTADVIERLNFEKIHRCAPKLNAYQLKSVCIWLRDRQDLNTEQFIDYLVTQRLSSNVRLGEVQAVDLAALKGVDDVLQSLEANIIVPLENDELATELNLKPKRGVLLAGPPGTGKTTIGRALAHRLKSKFFLIDCTFISGTGDFYAQVTQVFEAAKQNAPAVIFIDDSDAIFEKGEELGLYRYLLTMLDGLESESLGRICVMMTAMNIGHLPPALIRSGRIELWLEMKLPDQEARRSIFSAQLTGLPAALAQVEMERLLEATEGFTGADIKRLVEDGKTLYAYDKVKGLTIKPATEYFLSAIETVMSNKQKYLEAEAVARQQQSGSAANLMGRVRAAIYNQIGNVMPGADEMPE